MFGLSGVILLCFFFFYHFKRELHGGRRKNKWEKQKERLICTEKKKGDKGKSEKEELIENKEK